MASFNRVILLGNVTRDPEVRYLPSGSAVTELGLAVNRYWTDKSSNERREETTFIDVTLWGRQAEIAGEYLAKGRPVLIEGRLQLDTWDDKETGKKRSRLKVVGETMQLLGSRQDSAAGGGSPSSGGGSPSAGGGFSNRAPAGSPAAAAPSQKFAQPDGSSQHKPDEQNYGVSPDQSFYDDVPDAPPDDEVPF